MLRRTPARAGGREPPRPRTQQLSTSSGTARLRRRRRTPSSGARSRWRPGAAAGPASTSPTGSSSGAEVTPESGLPRSRTVSAPSGRPARPIARRSPTRVRPIAAIPSDDRLPRWPSSCRPGRRASPGGRRRSPGRRRRAMPRVARIEARPPRTRSATITPARIPPSTIGREPELNTRPRGSSAGSGDHVGGLSAAGCSGCAAAIWTDDLLEHLGDCRAAGRGGQHLDAGRAPMTKAPETSRLLDRGRRRPRGSRTAETSSASSPSAPAVAASKPVTASAGPTAATGRLAGLDLAGRPGEGGDDQGQQGGHAEHHGGERAPRDGVARCGVGGWWSSDFS